MLSPPKKGTSKAVANPECVHSREVQMDAVVGVVLRQDFTGLHSAMLAAWHGVCACAWKCAVSPLTGAVSCTSVWHQSHVASEKRAKPASEKQAIPANEKRAKPASDWHHSQIPPIAPVRKHFGSLQLCVPRPLCDLHMPQMNDFRLFPSTKHVMGCHHLWAHLLQIIHPPPVWQEDWSRICL